MSQHNALLVVPRVKSASYCYAPQQVWRMSLGLTVSYHSVKVCFWNYFHSPLNDCFSYRQQANCQLYGKRALSVFLTLNWEFLHSITWASYKVKLSVLQIPKTWRPAKKLLISLVLIQQLISYDLLHPKCFTLLFFTRQPIGHCHTPFENGLNPQSSLVPSYI